MNSPSWFLYILSWLTTTYAVYRLFEKTEDVIKTKSKKQIAKWLKNIEVKEEYNWGSTFKDLFENVFTKKHFSWKCFFMSVLTTYLLFFLVIIIVVSIFSIEYKLTYPILASNFIIVSISNIFPDYASLYLSRLLINILDKTQSFLGQIFILILDIFLTFIIFTCFVYIIVELSSGHKIEVGKYYSFLNDFFLSTSLNPIRTMNDFDAIFLSACITTFLTSFWLWGYFLSSLIIKFIYTFKLPLDFFKRHLDINRKPIKSIGLVFMMLITVFYILFGLYWLF